MSEFEEGLSEDIWANQSLLGAAVNEQDLLHDAAHRAYRLRRSPNPINKIIGHVSGFFVGIELRAVEAQIREARALPQPRD